MMKIQVVIALLATLMQARRHDLPDEADENAKYNLMFKFMEFQSQYNKHYASTKELNDRSKIFEQNEEKIAKLNQKNVGKGKSARFAMNQFGDLTPEEFKQR